MKTKNTSPKPIYPIHQRLKIAWWGWLVFRLVGIAVSSHLLLASQPNIIGGIAWQGLWLIPAIICTPFIVKGKSPYALVMISMITLIYLGGSGMVMLKHGYGQVWGLMSVWLVDFILLGLINYWLFVLLKRLPKMNG